MIITALYFGPISDSLGCRQTEVALDDSTSVRSFVEQLRANHPELTKKNLVVAINEEYVGFDALLNDRDELAIFTPVSGG